MAAMDRVRMRVGLVVQVLDDFTDRPVQGGGCRLWIDGAGPPFIRRDGYYVFVNLPEGTGTLHIEHPFYSPRSLTARFGRPEPSEPVMKVRMSPGITYPVPGGATGVKGRAKRECPVQLVCREKSGYYKLLLEYGDPGKGRFIAIYNPDGADFDGRRFRIEGRDGSDWEYFTILHTAGGEDKFSLMDRSLQNSYKKIGTRVIPVYETRTDRNGDFFLLLPQGESGGGEYAVSVGGPGSREAVVKLEVGKINEIQLEEG